MSDNDRDKHSADDSERWHVTSAAIMQALDCAGLGLWDHDFCSGEVRRSEVWATMLGYRPEEVVPELISWLELIHPDDREEAVAAARAHQKGETESFSVVHRMKAKSGEWRWIHNWGRVVSRDEQGRPLRALGFHRDVSDERAVQEALRESEAKYRSVVERSADYIFLITIDSHRILEANNALQKLLGYTSQELLGLSVYEFVAHPPDDIDSQLEVATSQGYHFLGERWYRRKDGSLLPVEVSFSRIAYRDKEALCVVSRDISVRHRYETEMQKSWDELEKRVQERTAELEEANRQLVDEREALAQKNYALNELIQQIDSRRDKVARQVQSNVGLVAQPLLARLEESGEPGTRLSAGLLRHALEDIVSPFVTNIGSQFDRLTPREIQICSMVRNGLNTKEIAMLLNTSPETVRTQRVVIRRKLGLTNSKTNLRSYLRRLTPTPDHY